MKLAVLGGGGVRVPAFVRSVLADPCAAFGEIALFEPDQARRDTICRLAAGVAAAIGRPGVVTVTADPREAFAGADFVFSAIRVGGDRGRVIDEQVALRRGLVGQETTGPGGCAMALRTIPVLLAYCELLAEISPGAVLVNFTNPVGVITQALTLRAKVQSVGVCDTPSGTASRLAEFLGADPARTAFGYAGLNHLGWVTSVTAGGGERIGDLLARYEQLQAFDHRFAAFDAAFVRRLGAIPTEYLYYFYEPRHYVQAVARAGASRGQDVRRLNAELVAAVAKALDAGGAQQAWAAYATLMGVRRGTYMRTDTEGDSGQAGERARRAELPPERLGDARAGGYEGVALRVVAGLAGGRPGRVVINTPNGASLPFLDPDDVVEVPALVDGSGVAPLAAGPLPRSARALVMQVKDYERLVVQAAVSGSAELAAQALAMHPLVPGVTVARELISEYRERHGPDLGYLS